MKRVALLSLIALGSHASLALAQPNVGAATVSPHFVVAGQPSFVTFQVSIPDPTVMLAAVNVLRISASGAATIIGALHDDGLGGDAVSGDGVFTWQGMITEIGAGEIRFQLSAAFRGTLLRVRRDFPTVFVQASNASDLALASIAADLSSGNITTASHHFEDSVAATDLFSKLNFSDLNQLAASFRAAQLVETVGEYRRFQMPWTLGGPATSLEFTMSLDLLGNWLIVSW